MEVTTSKRMGSMMLVAALILWTTIGANAASRSCKLTCALLCADDPLPFVCIPNCLKTCSNGSLTSSALEHCDVGCFFSTCLDYHSDTKKVGVDMKKVRACVDSCSQGCQKTYPLN
ncbi:uncharacterized protein LOC115731672 [Rhodamnia argentea]|uniref:Uncharacterized protein LOC115731672 n=1 Tax=Rhodamnia argentea TaxID=178133 RepID=A0A8B8N705_9MYRT|nr:uncharacterized protein LOC115731672 [Rhodamnia argentea]